MVNTCTSTFSDIKTKPLTIKDIKKACYYIKLKEKKPIKRKWLNRIMNKFGWHRKYEIIVIDKNRLIHNFYNKKYVSNLSALPDSRE